MILLDTSGTCYILVCSLVSWHSKNQEFMDESITKAKYMVVKSCCAQSIWMKHQLEEFNMFIYHISLKCDNTSAINL